MNKSNSPEQKEILNDYFALALLTTLYIIQGIPIGFFASSIPTILTTQGAHYSELAILSLLLYPFSLKILTAVLQDSFFINSFGKRQTYIVPIQYLMSLAFFITAYIIEDMIKKNEIVSITILGFLHIFLSANQDIAVDGLVLTALSPQKVSMGGACNTIGQMIGIMLGSSVFIQLSSGEFIKQYFPWRTQPFIDSFSFCVGTAVFILVINIAFHLFYKQKNPEEKDFKNLKEVVVSIKNIFKNTKIIFFVFFVSIVRIGLFPITLSFTKEVLSKGFQKEWMATIELIQIPVSIALIIQLSHILNRGKEMTQYMKIIWISTAFSLLLLGIYFILDWWDVKSPSFFYVFLFVSLAMQCLECLNSTIRLGFTNVIIDPSIGGTQSSLITTFMNLMGKTGESLSYLLLEYINVGYLSFLGILLSAILLTLMKKKAHEIEQLEPEDWKIKQN